MDIKQPEGRALVTELVCGSDLVFDNFSAKAMRGMGFGIDALPALKPDIVHVTMPGFGVSGPNSDFVAYGPSVEPMSGYTALLGCSDAEPRLSSMALPDAIAGVTAAAAAVTALYRRDVLGETGLVECALHECAVAMLGEQFVALQRRGTPPPRRGTAHPVHAPQGVYRCAADDTVGDDGWLAIAVTNDTQWQALAAVLGLPDEPAWAHAAGRHKGAARVVCPHRGRDAPPRQAGLDASPAGCGRAGRGGDGDAGLARGPAPRKAAVLRAARRGAHRRAALSRVAGADRRAAATGWFAAPRLGEHNAWVACGRLGWSRERYEAARASGALVERPPDGPTA